MTLLLIMSIANGCLPGCLSHCSAPVFPLFCESSGFVWLSTVRPNTQTEKGPPRPQPGAGAQWTRAVPVRRSFIVSGTAGWRIPSPALRR